MTVEIRCTVSPGLFSSEYVVEVVDDRGRHCHLFAPVHYVRCDAEPACGRSVAGWLAVETVAGSDAYTWCRLPVSAVLGNRFVLMRNSDVRRLDDDDLPESGREEDCVPERLVYMPERLAVNGTCPLCGGRLVHVDYGFGWGRVECAFEPCWVRGPWRFSRADEPIEDEVRVVGLKVWLYDGNGTSIERFQADTEEAIRRIATFVELHGTDPEESGRGAQPGHVRFEPIRRSDR